MTFLTGGPKFYGLNWAAVVAVLVGVVASFYLYFSGLDLQFQSWVLANLRDPWMVEMWYYMSRMGQAWFQIVVCIIVGYIYYKHQNYIMSRVWYMSIWVYMLTGLFGYVWKCIIGRPRPKMMEYDMYDPSWFTLSAKLHSWPSGHTITTFAWLACLMPFYPRWVQGIFFVIASVLSFSRIGGHAHYAGDVLAGAVLGYAVGVMLREKFKLGQK